MKFAKPLVATVATVLLAGCATSGDSFAQRSPRVVDSRYDGVKIAAVEKTAADRGVQVVWFHPPEKKRPAPVY